VADVRRINPKDSPAGYAENAPFTQSSIERSIEELITHLGVKWDDGDVILAEKSHRIGRVRSNGLALHEKDAAHDSDRLRGLDGRAAAETESHEDLASPSRR